MPKLVTVVARFMFVRKDAGLEKRVKLLGRQGQSFLGKLTIWNLNFEGITEFIKLMYDN